MLFYFQEDGTDLKQTMSLILEKLTRMEQNMQQTDAASAVHTQGPSTPERPAPGLQKPCAVSNTFQNYN